MKNEKANVETEEYEDESKRQTRLSSDLINAGSTAIFDIALLSFSGPAYKSQKKGGPQ